MLSDAGTPMQNLRRDGCGAAHPRFLRGESRPRCAGGVSHVRRMRQQCTTRTAAYSYTATAALR